MLLVVLAVAFAARLANLSVMARLPVAEYQRSWAEGDMATAWAWSGRIVAGDLLGRDPVHQYASWMKEIAPVETWERLVRVMLFGAFYLTRAALPHMYAKGWGRIVNIASVHGLVASPYKSAYVAAKHGLVGFTKAVALEAAEKGVTVNAVCPSYVRTPLVEKQIADQAKIHGISEDTVIREWGDAGREGRDHLELAGERIDMERGARAGSFSRGAVAALPGTGPRAGTGTGRAEPPLRGAAG